MKRTIIVLLVATALGGCAQLGTVGTGISLVTKSVTNPVTTSDLYAVEASVRIGVSALQAYKRACVAGSADKSCRANVQAIQAYTRQMTPLLVQLRGFVKNNDQINAAVVYNQLTTLYANAKTIATNLGVNFGSAA